MADDRTQINLEISQPFQIHDDAACLQMWYQQQQQVPDPDQTPF